jgi:transposase-like protein
MLSSREKAAQTQRKRADSEIDQCIALGTPFGLRKIVDHAPWDGHLRQVVVECKCGKREVVKYAWLKHKLKFGKMRQCVECGRESISGEAHPYFAGGGRRGPGVDRAARKYKRAHPNCERCGSSDDVHVDHKLPVSRRPDLAADPTNFESLCAICHAEKSREDGMAHVAAMLISSQQSSAVQTTCLYCKGPMFTYPTRANPPKFCSMACKGLSMRKLPPETIDEMVTAYLAGGASAASLGKKHGISSSSVLYALRVKGLDPNLIASISDANRAAAKRLPDARDAASLKSRGRNAKLSEVDVRRIKAMLRAGATQAEIAQAYGVSAATIGHIATKRIWAWVEL